MAKAFNPFEHHHHHDADDHDHHHHEEPLDPGQRSLADSLRVSFFILKLVMVALVIIYLCSGIFFVRSGEVAIVLRFGQIVGSTADEQTVQSGKLHFAMPFPIDQIIRIPVNERQFELSEEFWFARGKKTQTEDELAASAGPLNPELQGSLVTGDANIVHARWSVKYAVRDPVAFVRTLADATITDSDRMMNEAELMVKSAVEQGIVAAVSRVSADDIIRRRTNLVEAEAMAHAQATLDRMGKRADGAVGTAGTGGSGILIREVRAMDTSMPLSVRAAYQGVITAENENADSIARARKLRAEILGGAAGEAHEALWELVKRYEIAVEANNADEVAKLEAAFSKAFIDKTIAGADGSVTILSGEVASAISEAEAFQNDVATKARREAATFVKLKADYDANPRIFLNRQWAAIKERIFTNPDFETFMFPPSQMELLLSRDPELQKKREIERQKTLQDQQNNPGR